MAVLLPSCTLLRDFLAKKNLASPPQKKFVFRGQETVKTPPQIERGRRRPGKTAAKNTPDLGGAKVGLNDLF